MAGTEVKEAVALAAALVVWEATVAEVGPLEAEMVAWQSSPRQREARARRHRRAGS